MFFCPHAPDEVVVGTVLEVLWNGDVDGARAVAAIEEGESDCRVLDLGAGAGVAGGTRRKGGLDPLLPRRPDCQLRSF